MQSVPRENGDCPNRSMLLQPGILFSLLGLLIMAWNRCTFRSAKIFFIWQPFIIFYRHLWWHSHIVLPQSQGNKRAPSWWTWAPMYQHRLIRVSLILLKMYDQENDQRDHSEESKDSWVIEEQKPKEKMVSSLLMIWLLPQFASKCISSSASPRSLIIGWGVITRLTLRIIIIFMWINHQ